MLLDLCVWVLCLRECRGGASGKWRGHKRPITHFANTSHAEAALFSLSIWVILLSLCCAAWAVLSIQYDINRRYFYFGDTLWPTTTVWLLNVNIIVWGGGESSCMTSM